MKLSACISWDNAKFEAVPFRGDFVHYAQKSADIGFNGIELAIRDTSVIDRDLVLATLERLQLDLSALGTGQAWGEDGLSFIHKQKSKRSEAVQRVHKHIEFASKTGAVVIIGLLRGVLPSTDDTEALAFAHTCMYECFSDCCDYATKYGVRIALEPINRYETSFVNSVEEGLSLIEKVGGSHLGLLIDTFHMNIEEPNIVKSIKMAGKNIFHFHYADSNRLYPGAGHIDFEAIVNTLYAIRYTGYLSGEHRYLPDPDTAVQSAYVYMASLLSNSKE